MDKHSSLLQPFFNYVRKKFYNINFIVNGCVQLGKTQYSWPHRTYQFTTAVYENPNFYTVLQNKQPEWGGQLYWAFPFS